MSFALRSLMVGALFSCSVGEAEERAQAEREGVLTVDGSDDGGDDDALLLAELEKEAAAETEADDEAATACVLPQQACDDVEDEHAAALIGAHALIAEADALLKKTALY